MQTFSNIWLKSLSIALLFAMNLAGHGQTEALTYIDHELRDSNVKQVIERSCQYNERYDSIMVGDKIILEFDSAGYLLKQTRENEAFARKIEITHRYTSDYSDWQQQYRFYENDTLRQEHTAEQHLYPTLFGLLADNKTNSGLQRDAQGRIISFRVRQSTGRDILYGVDYDTDSTVTLFSREGIDHQTIYSTKGQKTQRLLLSTTTYYGYTDDGLPEWEADHIRVRTKESRYLYSKDYRGNWTIKWQYARMWNGSWSLSNMWTRQIRYVDGTWTDAAMPVPEAIKLGLRKLVGLPEKRMDQTGF